MNESIDRDDCESEADNRGDDDTDHLDSLEPDRAVPTDCLEHAPEAVREVEPERSEPDEVESKSPPGTEGEVQEKVGIVLKLADAEELGKLHFRPESCEMVEDETDDHDSEHEHVAGGPGISGSLAGNFISLDTSAGDDILGSEPAAIKDMHEEAQCKNRHHNADERGRHEVASEFEESVSSAEKAVVSGHDTIFAGAAVNDREEVDRDVKKEENDKESTTHRLDEFLAD